jgi:hypothetical protein
VAQVVHGVDDHFRQGRQFLRKFIEFLRVSQDVAHVNAKHFPVFESVECFAPRRVLAERLRPIVDGAQFGFQLRLQLRSAFHRVQRIHIAHHGEEVGVLHPQEILPEKIADAEQPRQGVEDFGTLQRGQLVRPVVALEALADELAEVQQRGLGVGRLRQQVGEVFGQHRRRHGVGAASPGRDFVAVGVGDVKHVVDARPGGIHRHPGDVDALVGQGVGKFVEKPAGIQGVNVEHRVGGIGLVVYLDFDG